jgi:hypothetical protein
MKTTLLFLLSILVASVGLLYCVLALVTTFFSAIWLWGKFGVIGGLLGLFLTGGFWVGSLIFLEAYLGIRINKK